MTTIQVIAAFVGATVALLTGTMATNLLNRFLERRQKISVQLLALEPLDTGARSWLVTLTITKPLHQTEPIICYPGEAGNRVVGFNVLSEAAFKRRVKLNERGHLECDVSFLGPSAVIKLRCHLAKRGMPHFLIANKALKIGTSYDYEWLLTPARALMVAKWRLLWIFSLVSIVVAAALIRLAYISL